MGTFASYGGFPIFGQAVRMKTVINPSAQQLNAFFAVNGVESLFGGTRGRVTLVSGVFQGGTAAGLAAVEENMVTYNDGIARTLVDTRGYAYASVVFDAFEPTSERIMQDNSGRGYFRVYRAVFKHLT